VQCGSLSATVLRRRSRYRPLRRSARSRSRIVPLVAFLLFLRRRNDKKKKERDSGTGLK
jgi:hypothetical protein